MAVVINSRFIVIDTGIGYCNLYTNVCMTNRKILKCYFCVFRFSRKSLKILLLMSKWRNIELVS